jgi:hypothetical protein
MLTMKRQRKDRTIQPGPGGWIRKKSKQEKEARFLCSTHSEIAKEWHPTKNMCGPNQITYGSKMIAYWTCPKGHDYRAQIKNRTLNKSGCPKCQMSKPERRIHNALESTNIPFLWNVKIPLKGVGGRKLTVDFDLFDDNVVIEVQGPHHYRPDPRKDKTRPKRDQKERFRRTQENDKLKCEYCKKNKITFVTIRDSDVLKMNESDLEHWVFDIAKLSYDFLDCDESLSEDNESEVVSLYQENCV